MADLIDLEALIAECKQLCGIDWNKKAAPVSLAHAYEEFIDNIEAALTVDAVPVVRNDHYKVLKQKYVVFKARTGEIVENCFVLRPDKDPAAVAALRAYARETDNKTLANDIINWVGAEEEG